MNRDQLASVHESHWTGIDVARGAADATERFARAVVERLDPIRA
jgi:hypothetical protein